MANHASLTQAVRRQLRKARWRLFLARLFFVVTALAAFVAGNTDVADLLPMVRTHPDRMLIGSIFSLLMLVSPVPALLIAGRVGRRVRNLKHLLPAIKSVELTVQTYLATDEAGRAKILNFLRPRDRKALGLAVLQATRHGGLDLNTAVALAHKGFEPNVDYILNFSGMNARRLPKLSSLLHSGSYANNRQHAVWAVANEGLQATRRRTHEHMRRMQQQTNAQLHEQDRHLHEQMRQVQEQMQQQMDTQLREQDRQLHEQMDQLAFQQIRKYISKRWTWPWRPTNR